MTAWEEAAWICLICMMPISEINGEFQASYVKDTEDLEQPEEAKSTSGELTQLTKLHAEGALTDEEFAAAKKKVLGL